MKKLVLPLQVITIVGMITSMIVMFNTNSDDTLILSISLFMFFGLIGVVAIIIDEKIKRKTTNLFGGLK